MIRATSLQRASSAALLASGLAGLVMPARVADQLGYDVRGGRALLETRAGLGAGYAALGLFALVTDHPVAHRAVGAAWLGAASGRLTGMAVDDPETDVVHWGSLALEVAGGLTGLLSGSGPSADS